MKSSSKNLILNSNNVYLSLALEQAKIGYWELEPETLQLQVTAQFKRHFGFRPEDDVTYDQALKIIIPEDREPLINARTMAVHHIDGRYIHQFRIRLPGGFVRWLEITGNVILENDVVITTVGTLIDITGQKDLELVRDELINTTTHELKTPLSAVKGYLQLLRKFVVQTENTGMSAIAERALNSTDRITRLLAEMADPKNASVNQITLSKGSFDMRSLVEEIVSNANLIYEDYEVQVICENRLFTVNADRYRISQVLTNLINNAVKYSPVIKRIDVYLKDQGQLVKVGIQDYGIGISDDEKVKVFQKFYRSTKAPNNIEGSGIGLYLCAEIIAKHEGEIGIDNQNTDQGTCVYFTLPINESVFS